MNEINRVISCYRKEIKTLKEEEKIYNSNNLKKRIIDEFFDKLFKKLEEAKKKSNEILDKLISEAKESIHPKLNDSVQVLQSSAKEIYDSIKFIN